ncbi:MAG: hypothetical protein IJV31_09655 [Clostridia bacterium]|nr:hypothetical protein [Clostridia bacterium]
MKYIKAKGQIPYELQTLNIVKMIAEDKPEGVREAIFRTANGRDMTDEDKKTFEGYLKEIIVEQKKNNASGYLDYLEPVTKKRNVPPKGSGYNGYRTPNNGNTPKYNIER